MLRNYSRYSTAIAIGAAVTFGLLFVMQYMIASGQGRIDKNAVGRNVDFIRVERDETVKEKEKPPDPPPEPEEMPKMPEPVISQTQTTLQIAMVRPQVTMNTGLQGFGFGSTDGEYLPVTKPLPIYPPNAQSRGLEGYVVVEYIVTTTGSTRDVHVVESSSSLFERAAVDSAKKYKYSPRIIDGTPIEVTGVRTRIDFVLQD